MKIYLRCSIVAAGIGSHSSTIASSQNRRGSLFQADGRRVVFRRSAVVAFGGVPFRE